MSGKLKNLPATYQPGFLREMDGRAGVTQRLTVVFETIVADLGGEESLSHTKLALIERFVFLEAMLQTWEAEIATNPTAAEKLVGRWVQSMNALQGLARLIGLERREPKVMGLKNYLKGRSA